MWGLWCVGAVGGHGCVLRVWWEVGSQSCPSCPVLAAVHPSPAAKPSPAQPIRSQQHMVPACTAETHKVQHGASLAHPIPSWKHMVSCCMAGTDVWHRGPGLGWLRAVVCKSQPCSGECVVPGGDGTGWVGSVLCHTVPGCKAGTCTEPSQAWPIPATYSSPPHGQDLRVMAQSQPGPS